MNGAINKKRSRRYAELIQHAEYLNIGQGFEFKHDKTSTLLKTRLKFEFLSCQSIRIQVLIFLPYNDLIDCCLQKFEFFFTFDSTFSWVIHWFAGWGNTVCHLHGARVRYFGSPVNSILFRVFPPSFVRTFTGILTKICWKCSTISESKWDNSTYNFRINSK